MDGFVLDGLLDCHFPYTEPRIPPALTEMNSGFAFIVKQDIILTGAKELSIVGEKHVLFGK